MANITKKTGRLSDRPEAVEKVVNKREPRIICHDEVLGEEESRIFALKSEKVYQESLDIAKKMKLNML